MPPRGILLSTSNGNDPFDYPLYARSGWRIPTVAAPFELSVELLRIKSDVRMRTWTRGLERRSVSAYPYNCVGMIFAVRRAIIEIDHIYRLLDEDGYREIRREDAQVGD
jgi:hypothetical protein